MVSGLDSESFHFILIMCWALWYNRNQQMHGNKRWGAQDLVLFVRDYMAEFVQAQQQRVMHSVSIPAVWNPPEHTMMKINVDGAKFKGKRLMGLGVVVRNWIGSFIVGHSLRVDGCFDAEVIEALLALEAIKLAHLFGFRRVVLEGDASNVIWALNSSGPILSNIGNIIEEAQHVASQFERVIFQHVRRGGNEAAHVLARRAIRLEDSRVWVDCAPSFLQDVLLSDSSRN